MRGEVQMSVPEVALVLGIRAAIGVGAGLLLADRFASAGRRRAVGRTLLAAGLFAGGCVAAEIFGFGRRFRMRFGKEERVVSRGRPREYWPAESELGEVPVE